MKLWQELTVFTIQVMVNCLIQVNVIKILQGSAVTQTVLGGLTVYPPAANFLIMKVGWQ